MNDIKEDYFDIMYEPLAGSSLSNLFHLLAQNRFRISIPYLPRLIYALSLSTLIFPFRLKEHYQYHKKISNISIAKDPLFIIGHWRSGTTFLHNVLSVDPRFGYCSTFHATLPAVFLSSEHTLKPVLSASIPTTRPMDDVAMGTDLPQEEEYALANIIPYGYYNGWCFPKNIDYYMSMIALDEQPLSVQQLWKENYGYFIKKLTYYQQKKQLVLKNPAHTARIKTLLELYPHAKFIHIHRHPYDVFSSMRKFMRIVLPRYCLQTPPSITKMEKYILKSYRKLYQKYLKQKSLLATDQLIEISYDEFISDPLAILDNVYSTLDIDQFGSVKQLFQRYLTDQRKVKTSTYQLTAEQKQRIQQHWQFAFDAFNYEV